MRGSGLLVASLLLGLSRPAPAAAEGLPNPEDPWCPGFGSAPDLAKCAAWGAFGKHGKLKAIQCAIETINEWRNEQLRCLEEHIEGRASQIMYPARQVFAQVGMVFRGINTLRSEVEKIACGWRFSPRTRLLEGVYLRRVKLCRPSFQSIFGKHDDYWTAPWHELAAWTSVTTKNLIAERTGLETDLGPEATWMYTATSVARGHVEAMRSPAQAIRLTSTSMADSLRARNSTLQMEAQRLLVGEQLRAWRAARQANRDAIGWYLTTSVASWKEPCEPLEEACP